MYKPQYLDFTSPLFTEIFRSALRSHGDPMTFEEMLPELEDLPRAQGDERWAVELHLDTLPFGPDDLPAALVSAPGRFTLTSSLTSSLAAVGERSV